jgi:spore coat protein U-like protein
MSFSLSRTLRALRLPLFCGLLWWVGVGSAQAANCTATMTTLSFGTVELLDGSAPPPVTATLSYTCNNTSNNTESLRVCFNIGDGDQSLGSFDPRLMKLTTGTSTLRFRLFQGTSGTVWGSNGNAAVPNPFTDTMTIPRRSSITRSTTMRGELLALQGTAPAGPYTDNFGGIHTSITLSSNSGSSVPTTCNGSSSGNFPFAVNATVANSCLVTAGPPSQLNFGNIDGLPGMANRDQASDINVACSTSTVYKVGLSPSNGSTIGAGVMTPTGGVPGNTDTVAYRLYSNAARSSPWGNVVDTNTVTGTGTGTAQALTVYGRVLGSSVNVRPDSYRDVVTVTVSY